MPSSYPSAFDDIGDRGATQALTTTHGTLHDRLMEATEKTQTVLGLNPQGSYATVAARLAATTGDESVGAAELNQALIWDRLLNGWASYTPGVTGFGTLGVSPTVEAMWRRQGQTVQFQCRIVFGSSPSFNNIVKVALPTAALDDFANGPAMYQDESVPLKMPASWNVDDDAGNQLAAIVIGGTPGPTAGQVGIASGVNHPNAPVGNCRIFMSGTYRSPAPPTANSL